jgi:hypothetical protein
VLTGREATIGTSRKSELKRGGGIVAAIAVAALAIAAGLAQAGTFSQPKRVLVSTTGDHSELVRKLNVTTTPGAAKRVVMSLPPSELGRLRTGDRLRASSEVEVTTDCEVQSDRCVGSPYTFDPTIDAQLILAPDATTTGGPTTTPISTQLHRTCVQQHENRQHHCVLVFTKPSLDVSTPTLPCSPGACYVNLVADAYNPAAQPGDVVLVGEDEPDGSIHQDKGRVNAIRLRPNAPGPRPRAKVRTFVKPTPQVDRVAIGSNQAGLQRTVVLSKRLRHLSRHVQLEVRAAMQTDVSKLPYNVLVNSRLILTSGPRANTISPLAARVSTLGGELTEANGSNCTHPASPCQTLKAGVGRLTGRANSLFVNLVVATKALRANPDPGDTLRIASGKLKVIRYPASRFG